MHPIKFRCIWQSGFRGEDFFRNQPIRNKNCLWRPCLLTDRDEMSYPYRGPAIDASYQVSVHLAKRFQRRRFKVALSTIKPTNQPNSFYHVLLNRRDFRCLFVVALFIQLLFRIIFLVQIFTFKVFFFLSVKVWHWYCKLGKNNVVYSLNIILYILPVVFE